MRVHRKAELTNLLRLSVLTDKYVKYNMDFESQNTVLYKLAEYENSYLFSNLGEGRAHKQCSREELEVLRKEFNALDFEGYIVRSCPLVACSHAVGTSSIRLGLWK